jgi:hypothetical protein
LDGLIVLFVFGERLGRLRLVFGIGRQVVGVVDLGLRLVRSAGLGLGRGCGFGLGRRRMRVASQQGEHHDSGHQRQASGSRHREAIYPQFLAGVFG